MVALPSGTRLSKNYGSTWVTNYEGKLWPVVLCDDETSPPKFVDTRPSGFVFPAILLGKLKFIWVAGHKLSEYEPSTEYIEGQAFKNRHVLDTDSEADKSEKLRLQAFVDHAKEFESPAFWKNCIEQRSAARKVDREIAAKRKRSQDEDAEVQIVSVRQSSSVSAGPPKRRRQDNGIRSRNNGLPTPESNARKRTGSIRPKEEPEDSDNDLFVRQSRSQSDPFVSSGGEDDERKKNRKSIQDNPPDDDTCTIFVGPDQIAFLVRKEGVGECDFLTDRVVFTEELRSHIELDEDTDIKAKDFVPVAEYLHKGEFAPRLIESSNFQRLEGVVLAEEKDIAATNIAKLYLTAAKIQFGALQLLCVNKLKALYPLRSNNLLAVLMIIMKSHAHGREAEYKVKAWLVDHVVRHFWTLVKNEGQTFARLMRVDSEMKRSILEKLGQNPGMGVDVD